MKRKSGEKKAIVLRALIVIFLFTTFQIQLFYTPEAYAQKHPFSETSTAPDVQRNCMTSSWAISQAEKFLHLPTLSNSYHHHKEISCHELQTAYHTLQNYVSRFESGSLSGYVRVRLNSTMPVSCRMSTFYNAFIIALLTNRTLTLETNETDILWLRSEHVHRYNHSVTGNSKHLSENYTFSCDSVFNNIEILEVSGCMWPQIAYVHKEMAEKLRRAFGIHAVYFIGNYLFNVNYSECTEDEEAVGAITVVSYSSAMWGMTADAVMRKSETCRNGTDVIVINVNEYEDAQKTMCKIRQMMRSTQIVFPFGAVVPWFAMAMQGAPGITTHRYMDGCIELGSSQAGSIVHTYNPMKKFHYAVNNDLFVCGENFDDVRLFVRDLLW